MGIRSQDKTHAAIFGYGDIAVGIAGVQDPRGRNKAIKRALCLNQIETGKHGRPIPNQKIDWTNDQLFIIFDKHETVDIVIEKLYLIKDTLKEAGL